MTVTAHPSVLPEAAFEAALRAAPDTKFGVYVHVPFCATRCGYCDFNTYTAGELGTAASPQSWLDALQRELDLAATMIGSRARPADTVFVGGGTPSLLGAGVLAEVLATIRSTFGLQPDAEVTSEANPESTSPQFFDDIRAAGYTRVSLGMQSAASHVLSALDRTHTPGRAIAAAREARNAGFRHINLDLIYGTPGERDADLDASLDAVLTAGADHVSAYALIVEDGTALARRIKRGELPAPDDDVLAARYERIDSRLSAAGFSWYEVSNWAQGPESVCRHNIGYWDESNWWGAGPGAHSHVGGVRWWNVKHPARYAAELGEGRLPISGAETLTAAERHLEYVMLTTRMRGGLELARLSAPERAAAQRCADDGLVTIRAGRMLLTDRGRLLADGVVRAIVTAGDAG
ncbi:radical SAM family heme chaperone HemW [Hoyosella sp. YIM 151337]|uniref:radical SAM family heme chaperone HemW n=1 Tax=Hoyosella sp. YIM 151337 TaxID=2992742 RepID=UPI0022367E77|nr:radical SAM family heme chaperone HemW [Hoyosella sp. YIM 151337]MCW4355299.1 radical SAM family heme chaperone HemW [Hoyosella sp. YIM 151337]